MRLAYGVDGCERSSVPTEAANAAFRVGSTHGSAASCCLHMQPPEIGSEGRTRDDDDGSDVGVGVLEMAGDGFAGGASSLSAILHHRISRIR